VVSLQSGAHALPLKTGDNAPWIMPCEGGVHAMIPHPFFSLVVVLGLLWIFCICHMAWPGHDKKADKDY